MRDRHIRNSYRTFRVRKLWNETETTYNLEAENGYDEWKITSDIVEVWVENNVYYFKTINGSLYCAFKYEEFGSRTTIVRDYMRINGFTDNTILSEDEFLGRFFSNETVVN